MKNIIIFFGLVLLLSCGPTYAENDGDISTKSEKAGQNVLVKYNLNKKSAKKDTSLDDFLSDIDQDGDVLTISRDEWSSVKNPDDFDKFDKNKDGFISKEETKRM